ncbi:DNA internalization-related competence protein ComEC/Rec2, partial [bacterium]|nr:DNA internalization-related competence protein ComEC/Rec2 [bacterium]
YAVERLRDAIRSRVKSTLPDAPYLGVLIALTVGDQRAIPSAQWKVFNRTGITHLVSISGLHVTMLAALLGGLFGALWRRSERLMLFLPAQKAAILAGGLAAFAYALLAGFEVPAQRTLYMLSVVAVALWSGRNFGVSRTLLLALLLVLVLDPWAVLAVGFWLSFGAVALLFYVGTGRVGEVRGWRANLPLLLLFFQQFSLVSPLANALAIPLVSFAITPLALLFAVLPWPPLLFFDHWLIVQLMLALEWLADFPVWQQSAPPLWASLLGGLGIFWLLLPRGFPARWLGACLLLPALFYPSPRPEMGAAWIEVPDVGQGLAVLVRTAEHALLYDTGPMYSAESDAGQRIVVPYLRATGVKRLDALVLTHRDKDHSGGLLAVQEALPIARTLSSVAELPGEACAAGQQWEWDGVRFAILHPEASVYEQQVRKTNNLSCVLSVENTAGRVLLTSDIEAVDEQALLARSPAALRSDILLVPHHGSRTSSMAAFIAAVDAREVIYPVGYLNRYGHPRPDVVKRYAGSGRQWRTDRDGELRITLSGSIVVSAFRQERRRYWQGH